MKVSACVIIRRFLISETCTICLRPSKLHIADSRNVAAPFVDRIGQICSLQATLTIDKAALAAAGMGTKDLGEFLVDVACHRKASCAETTMYH